MADTSSDGVGYDKVDSGNAPEQSIPPGSNEEISSGKSWRAPATILASLLVGLVVALAHDFMNVHLNGQPVANVRVSQAWISRFSTALAFLVKIAFATSVRGAFIQQQWLRFHRQSFKIVDVDTITSVLENPLGFFTSPVWFRHPILLLIAFVSWTIPFAAVVTPGSLSVFPVRTTTIKKLQVPQPLYNETNYGSVGGGGENFISAQKTLYKLAYATASSAQPVSLSSIYENQTYHLQFDGPAVKCGMANDSVVEELSRLFGEPLDTGGDGNLVTFASWVAGDEQAYNLSNAYTDFQTLDAVSTDGARIFVMSNTGLWDLSVPKIGSSNTTFHVRRVNVTECLLFNATYNVEFAFQYPQQTCNTSISSWLNPVSAPNFAILDPPDINGVISYTAMMTVYGKLLVGVDQTSHYGTDDAVYTSWNIMDIDWTRSEAVQSGLEQLFQNYTLSLLSSSGLIKNSTQADFVPVTVETWPITYIYDRFDLLLAYGLSFLCACICAVAGLYSFIVNHDSYQNLFSTFLRTTNDPDLRVLIRPSDAGADPLPKHLTQVRIRMISGE